MLLLKLPLAEQDSKKAAVFFCRSVAIKGGSHAFQMETMETGDKTSNDFYCMQMSLVMSMQFIFYDDWNDTVMQVLAMM